MCGQYIPFKSWAKDDKPREKLMQKGVSALSTNELLAIILRSGLPGESVLELSRRIMSDCHDKLSELSNLSVRDFVKKYRGVGVAKAAGIVVALELGRRRIQERIVLSRSVCSSAEAYAYIAPVLKDLQHEEFWVIFLNRANRVLGSECLSVGGMASTVIDVRILFQKALEIRASALIIAHNHPGASLYPSEHDRAITEKIKAAGKLLDIVLHDHLIIAGDGYYSFVDEEILTPASTVK